MELVKKWVVCKEVTLSANTTVLDRGAVHNEQASAFKHLKDCIRDNPDRDYFYVHEVWTYEQSPKNVEVAAALSGIEKIHSDPDININKNRHCEDCLLSLFNGGECKHYGKNAWYCPAYNTGDGE